MSKKKTSSHPQEYWTYPAITQAFEIALYYGFATTDPFSIEPCDKTHTKQFLEDEGLFIKPDEKAAILRTFFSDASSAVPIMIAHVHDIQKKSASMEFCLDIVGTQRSIADAMIIKTSYEIARAEGYSDLVLEINSVGDRESFARYTRELGNFFRKHMNELHNDCRQILKKDIYAKINCAHTECQNFIAHVPHAMNFLSEPSRNYFMELLEFLETSDVPYTINNTLLANHSCAVHTVFQIVAGGKEKPQVIVYGSRWGQIAKKMGFKKDIQGTSAVILVARGKNEKKIKLLKPKIYFIQMGQEAKLRSLSIIETLRQAHIPVYHSLIRDKLTAQLSSAESLHVPHILIMGKKESLENTILVRAMSNRSQETVKICNAIEYIKHIID